MHVYLLVDKGAILCMSQSFGSVEDLPREARQGLAVKVSLVYQLDYVIEDLTAGTASVC